MAKLIASLNTNRWGRRSHSTTYGASRGQTHRLGDTWVEAEVANHDHRIEVQLTSEGGVLVGITDLEGGQVLYTDSFRSVDELVTRLQRGAAPPQVVHRHRRGKRHRNRMSDELILKEA